MTSGASLWPTKMFEAAHSDSTRLMPVIFSSAPPIQRTASGITPI